MSGVDWEIVRVQYEVHGLEVVDIARMYDTSERLVNYAISENNWIKADKQVVPSNPETLIEDIEARLETIKTMKKAALSPMYSALETSILSKAQTIVSSLDTTNPLAASTLKQVSDILSTMSENSGNSEKGAGGKDKGGVTVRIMNRSEDGPGTTSVETGVEVQIEGVG